MSLSDLASLGSFASGIAVVISLITLALQMRQNTRALLRAEANVTQEQMSSWRLAIANSAELTTIWVKGSQDADLSDVEETRYSLLLQELSFAIYQVWDRGKNGMGGADDWERSVVNVAALLSTRRGAAWWQRNRPLFWPDYASAVEAAIRKAQASGAAITWPSVLKQRG